MAVTEKPDRRLAAVWHLAWTAGLVITIALLGVTVLHHGGDGTSALEEVRAEHALEGVQTYAESDWLGIEDADNNYSAESALFQGHRTARPTHAASKLMGALAKKAATQDAIAAQNGVRVRDAEGDVAREMNVIAREIQQKGRRSGVSHKSHAQRVSKQRLHHAGNVGGTSRAPPVIQRLVHKERCDAWCDKLAQGLPQTASAELLQRLSSEAHDTWGPLPMQLIHCECSSRRAQWVMRHMKRLYPSNFETKSNTEEDVEGPTATAAHEDHTDVVDEADSEMLMQIAKPVKKPKKRTAKDPRHTLPTPEGAVGAVTVPPHYSHTPAGGAAITANDALGDGAASMRHQETAVATAAHRVIMQRQQQAHSASAPGTALFTSRPYLREPAVVSAESRSNPVDDHEGEAALDQSMAQIRAEFHFFGGPSDSYLKKHPNQDPSKAKEIVQKGDDKVDAEIQSAQREHNQTAGSDQQLPRTWPVPAPSPSGTPHKAANQAKTLARWENNWRRQRQQKVQQGAGNHVSLVKEIIEKRRQAADRAAKQAAHIEGVGSALPVPRYPALPVPRYPAYDPYYAQRQQERSAEQQQERSAEQQQQRIDDQQQQRRFEEQQQQRHVAEQQWRQQQQQQQQQQRQQRVSAARSAGIRDAEWAAIHHLGTPGATDDWEQYQHAVESGGSSGLRGARDAAYQKAVIRDEGAAANAQRQQAQRQAKRSGHEVRPSRPAHPIVIAPPPVESPLVIPAAPAPFSVPPTAPQYPNDDYPPVFPNTPIDPIPIDTVDPAARKLPAGAAHMVPGQKTLQSELASAQKQVQKDDSVSQLAAITTGDAMQDVEAQVRATAALKQVDAAHGIVPESDHEYATARKAQETALAVARRQAIRALELKSQEVELQKQATKKEHDLEVTRAVRAADKLEAARNAKANKEAEAFAANIKAMATKVASLQDAVETRTDHAIAQAAERSRQVEAAIAQAHGVEDSLLRQKALMLGAQDKQAAVEAQVQAARAVLSAARHKEKDSKRPDLKQRLTRAQMQSFVDGVASAADSLQHMQGAVQAAQRRSVAMLKMYRFAKATIRSTQQQDQEIDKQRAAALKAATGEDWDRDLHREKTDEQMEKDAEHADESRSYTSGSLDDELVGVTQEEAGAGRSQMAGVMEQKEAVQEQKEEAVQELLAHADRTIQGDEATANADVNTRTPPATQPSATQPSAAVQTQVQPEEQVVADSELAVANQQVAQASLHMVDPLAPAPEPPTATGNSQEAALSAHGWYHQPEGPAVHMPSLEADLRKWEAQSQAAKDPEPASAPETSLYEPDPSMMAPLEGLSDDGLAEMATMSAGVGASTGLYILLGDLWRSSLPNHAGNAFPEIKKLSCSACRLVLEHGCARHGHFPVCASDIAVRRILKGCVEQKMTVDKARKNPFSCPIGAASKEDMQKATEQELLTAWHTVVQKKQPVRKASFTPTM